MESKEMTGCVWLVVLFLVIIYLSHLISMWSARHVIYGEKLKYEQMVRQKVEEQRRKYWRSLAPLQIETETRYYSNK